MKILCYGDSNTFGYDPRSYFGGRYEASCRWVDILAAETGWDVHNNSMNGREIPRREITVPKTLDFLIIMLGTNDLLQGCSPEATAGRMGEFINSLLVERQKILLIAPPPLKRGEWVSEELQMEASCCLAKQYRSLAVQLGIHFADAGEWNIPIAFDGVHFTEEGNKAFAKGLLEYIKQHLCQ